MRRYGLASHRAKLAPFHGEYVERLPTLAEAVGGFRDDLDLEGRHASARGYFLTLKPVRLDLCVSQLDTTLCRSLLADYGRTHASTTTSTFYAILSAFIAWLVEHRYLSVSPLVGVPKPKQRRPAHRYLTAAALRRLYQACESDVDRLIVLLCGGSGLRSGEIRGLRWRDVSLDTGTIRVLGKGSKWRELAPGPLALDLLSKSITGKSYTGYVLPFRSPTTLKYHVDQLARRAGVGRCTIHMLRHSFAVAWLEETDDAAALQGLLGHSSPVMTQYYTRTVREASAVRRQRGVDLGSRLFGE